MQTFEAESSPHNPQPVRAQLVTDIHGTAIRVTWSCNLQEVVPPARLNGRNWVANVQDRPRLGISGSAIGNHTVMPIQIGGDKQGHNVVDYRADIPDVRSLSNGTPAQAFYNFPVEIE